MPKKVLTLLGIFICVVASLATLRMSTAATTPVRAAFYYPWFSETWHSADHYHPTLGQYSSDDATVLDKHFDAMKYAGMDAAISSWWGQGRHSEQTRFPAELNAAAAHGMTVAPYYEKEGSSDTPLATIQSDLNYLQQYEQANPGAFLHVNGKPVIFVYNSAAATSTCSTVTKWRQATNGFTDWYVNMKVFAGYGSCADQPDNWHQYGPAVATDLQGRHSYTISPGFWLYSEASPRLARDMTRWQSNIASMKSSNADWQLVTSFNEWGEGTSVESANEWSSASGYGTYIDALHNALAPTTSPSPTPTPSPTASPTPTPTTSPSASPSTTQFPGGTFTASEDASVRQDQTTNNQNTVNLNADGSPVRRSYIKFNLPDGVPSTGTLRVYSLSSHSTSITINPAANTWNEATINWSNAPAPGATVGSVSRLPASAYVSIPVSGLKAGLNTLVIKRSNSTNATFASSESTNPNSPPQLVLGAGPTTTPSP